MWMYHVIKEAKKGEGKQNKMPLADILSNNVADGSMEPIANDASPTHHKRE